MGSAKLRLGFELYPWLYHPTESIRTMYLRGICRERNFNRWLAPFLNHSGAVPPRKSIPMHMPAKIPPLKPYTPFHLHFIQQVKTFDAYIYISCSPFKVRGPRVATHVIKSQTRRLIIAWHKGSHKPVYGYISLHSS